MSTLAEAHSQVHDLSWYEISAIPRLYVRKLDATGEFHARRLMCDDRNPPVIIVVGKQATDDTYLHAVSLAEQHGIPLYVI